MNAKQEEYLVFRDGSGDYYVIPRMDFEGYRVTDEQKARVDQLISESDVTGFGGPLLNLGSFTPVASDSGKLQGSREKQSNFRW